jgi:Tat protein translocase TatB subunit
VFLFILESIGTSELILIGIIALIFLGPRKLPQIARTIGKTMADFRNTTHEFKSTWEREVNFQEEAEALRSGDLASGDSNSATQRESPSLDTNTNTLAMPEIKPAQPNMFGDLPVSKETEKTTAAERPPDEISDKKNWL